MLKSYKTFLFDADGSFAFILHILGTLWNPKGIIPGSAEFIHYLKESGRKVLLVSNNSTKSVEKYLVKCKNLGLPLDLVCLFYV